MKRWGAALLALAVVTCAAGPGPAPTPTARANDPLPEVASPGHAGTAAEADVMTAGDLRQKLMSTGPTILMFALASLVPAAVLMVTSYVRISIVLTLLRQALGNPQVPGNQVLTALALLLTALVMGRVADTVYTRSLKPFADGQIDSLQAWEAGSGPIKTFMIEQILRTRHQDYLLELYDYAEPPGPRRVEPTVYEQFPLRIVAPAFLLSELTTALFLGFAIYLPFLVIDLVVSAVLAAMGLILMPPTLVALPIKLILFVLADGWMLVSGMLLRSFGL